MRKRWLALLLTLVMLLSLSAPALAAEARETDFFEDQEHGDVNFADMVYVPVDVEAALAAMEETRSLLEDEANIDAVREGFLAACELYTNASTMYSIANIRYSQDFANEENFANKDTSEQAAMDVQDGLYALARDILNSPCAAALDGIVTEEDAEYLRDYENLTEEEKALEAEITALEDEYQNGTVAEYTAEVNGVAYTEETAWDAYLAETMTEEEYDYFTNVALPEARTAALGDIYLRIMDAHKREAAMEEYENYAEYAYENYGRDYTPEEMQEFHKAVKEYIVPLYLESADVFYSLADVEVFYGDYTGDIALDMIDPYIASLSSEMYEAFTYMRTHGLYDTALSDSKDGRGYTTMLPAYHAPFFFDTPVGYLYDLTTAIHEFGHYNNGYWLDGSWYNGSKDLDTCEVHSQGLELLFTEFYPEMFGEAGDFVSVFTFLVKLEAIVTGALYDELQQYAFETENVTVQQLNEKYTELCREYGLTDADSTEMQLDWVDVPHTFLSPFYYISYAVSAAGAFEFWLEAQDDFYAGVDDYLRYTAQKMDEYSFQESFEALGMQSPCSAEFITALAEKLSAALDRYRRPTAAEYFSDVNGDEAWYEAVDALYSAGYLKGVKEGFLDAEGAMTRAQASTMLCRLFGVTEATGADYFTDVTEGHWYTDMVNAAYELDVLHGFEDGTFRPGDSMSRQDFAVVMYGIFQMIGSGFDELWSFDLEAADAEEIGDYALEAVSWGVMNGYITADENSDLRPTDDLTRAEMAEMIYLAFFGE